jgi:PIN domain nuclease of toxin-antitoxin system
MRALLDTHTLLWAVLNPLQLSPDASAFIRDTNNVICVSAASAWEIATKVRIGKLPHAVSFERKFMEVVTQVAQYTLLPISPEVALRAGRLQGTHKDPFDRIIAAQALAEDIPVIGKDAELDAFGVRRIW